jgi:hypothetical protein
MGTSKTGGDKGQHTPLITTAITATVDRPYRSDPTHAAGSRPVPQAPSRRTRESRRTRRCVLVPQRCTSQSRPTRRIARTCDRSIRGSPGVVIGDLRPSQRAPRLRRHLRWRHPRQIRLRQPSGWNPGTRVVSVAGLRGVSSRSRDLVRRHRTVGSCAASPQDRLGRLDRLGGEDVLAAHGPGYLVIHQTHLLCGHQITTPAIEQCGPK